MDRMDFPACLDKRCGMMRKSFKEHALFLILSEDRFSTEWDIYESDPSVEISLEVRLAYSDEQAHMIRSEEIAPRFQEFARAVENLAKKTMSERMKTLAESIERDSGGGSLHQIILVVCVPNPDQPPAETKQPSTETATVLASSIPPSLIVAEKNRFENISANDKRFLRSLRIASVDPDPMSP